MQQEDRSLELADRTRLIMKNYKEVLSMKDEIKNALVKVLWAMNIPFFLVRLLMAVIPLFIGLCMACDDTREDAVTHIWCCILEAMWISGPIGFLHYYCRYTWWGISFKDDVDDLEGRLEKELDK